MRFPLDQPAIHALGSVFRDGTGGAGPWQRLMAARLNRRRPVTVQPTWRDVLARWFKQLPVICWFQPPPPRPLAPALVSAAQAALVAENLQRGLPWFQVFRQSVAGAVEMLSAISDHGLHFAALIGAWHQDRCRRPLPALPELVTPADQVLAFWIFEDVVLSLAQRNAVQPGLEPLPRPAGGLRRTVILDALSGLSLQRDPLAWNAVGLLAVASPMAMLVYADTLQSLRTVTPETAWRYHAVICPGNSGAPGWQRVWIALIAQSLAAAIEAPAPSAELLGAVRNEQLAPQGFSSFFFPRPLRHLAVKSIDLGHLQQERFERIRALAAVFGHGPPGSHFFKGWFWKLQVSHWLATHEKNLLAWWEQSQSANSLRGPMAAMFAPGAPAVLEWGGSVLGVPLETLAARVPEEGAIAAMLTSLFAVEALTTPKQLDALKTAAGVTDRDIEHLVTLLDAETIMPFEHLIHGHNGPTVFTFLTIFHDTLQALAPTAPEIGESTRTTYQTIP